MIKIIELNLEKKEWSIEQNQYGIFLNRENLYQGFKILPDDQNITSVSLTLKETETEVKGLKVRSIETAFANAEGTPLNAYVKNNKLTLNSEIHLYAGETDKNETDTYIVMVDTNLAMVRSTTKGGDICSTFHNTREENEKYYGCVVHTKINGNDSDDDTVLRIQAREGDKYRFIQIASTGVSSSIIKKPETIENLEKEWLRNRKNGKFFQINDLGIRTSVLICPWDISNDALDELINDNLYWQKNEENEDAPIMVIRLSKKSNKKYITDADADAINSAIFGRPRRRAVTFYNCELPQKFVKDLKLLYMFRMDPEGRVRCTKSN